MSIDRSSVFRKFRSGLRRDGSNLFWLRHLPGDVMTVTVVLERDVAEVHVPRRLGESLHSARHHLCQRHLSASGSC